MCTEVAVSLCTCRRCVFFTASMQQLGLSFTLTVAYSNLELRSSDPNNSSQSLHDEVRIKKAGIRKRRWMGNRKTSSRQKHLRLFRHMRMDDSMLGQRVGPNSIATLWRRTATSELTTYDTWLVYVHCVRTSSVTER